ncbi:hypothetical protein T265_01191 [Opisthorchis viverrini]|uniref:Uncharacterized protein n=1 Tax=Opisthorchis viverrini TaxID=6198 RepID=A0A075AAS7_OPIVI|nr:hypothetical protein T265_01191 [Opisthorchis viverrini]KER32915.1 hypothetical protein T265_01191 [Opisthorchis viverrini]
MIVVFTGRTSEQIVTNDIQREEDQDRDEHMINCTDVRKFKKFGLTNEFMTTRSHRDHTVKHNCQSADESHDFWAATTGMLIRPLLADDLVTTDRQVHARPKATVVETVYFIRFVFVYSSIFTSGIEITYGLLVLPKWGIFILLRYDVTDVANETDGTTNPLLHRIERIIGTVTDCWSIRGFAQLDCKRFTTNRGDIVSAGLSDDVTSIGDETLAIQIRSSTTTRTLSEENLTHKLHPTTPFESMSRKSPISNCMIKNWSRNMITHSGGSAAVFTPHPRVRKPSNEVVNPGRAHCPESRWRIQGRLSVGQIRSLGSDAARRSTLIGSRTAKVAVQTACIVSPCLCRDLWAPILLGCNQLESRKITSPIQCFQKMEQKQTGDEVMTRQQHRWPHNPVVPTLSILVFRRQSIGECKFEGRLLMGSVPGCSPTRIGGMVEMS